MNISTAIKIGEGVVGGGQLITDNELREFALLGIEALKRIIYLRKDMDSPDWMTLPGETEE